MPSNCTYGCLRFHTTKKLSLFKIPRDAVKRKLWEESLGKTLKKTSQVCELHFDKDDILTEKIFTDSSGTVIGVGQYQKKILRANAIPKPCSLITVTTSCQPKASTSEPQVKKVIRNYRKYRQFREIQSPVVNDTILSHANVSTIVNFEESDDDFSPPVSDFDPLISKYVLYYIDDVKEEIMS